MATGLGSGAVVGAGWPGQVGRMGWTPTDTVAPPQGATVEVWWNNQVRKARYTPTMGVWVSVEGTALGGVTHWRRIEQ